MRVSCALPRRPAPSTAPLQPHLFSKAWFDTHLRDMTLNDPEMFTDNRCGFFQHAMRVGERTGKQ